MISCSDKAIFLTSVLTNICLCKDREVKRLLLFIQELTVTSQTTVPLYLYIPINVLPNICLGDHEVKRLLLFIQELKN